MKTKTITLYKSALWRDMESMSMKFTDATPDNVSIKTKDAIAMDTTEKLDASVAIRYTDLWSAQLRQRLMFCLDTPKPVTGVTPTAEPDSFDDKVDIEGEYVFLIKVPESMPQDVIRSVVTLMHNYIVRGALSDWYTQLGSDMGGQLRIDAEALESKIVSIFRQPNPVMHKPFPFMPSYKIR